jgi:hypothetical protein
MNVFSAPSISRLALLRRLSIDLDNGRALLAESSALRKNWA